MVNCETASAAAYESNRAFKATRNYSSSSSAVMSIDSYKCVIMADSAVVASADMLAKETL